MLLFFYGFATLCAQLTGNILILPVVYGILNFVAVAVDFLLHLVLGYFVYGMYRDGMVSDLACYLSPAVGMFRFGLGTPVRISQPFFPYFAQILRNISSAPGMGSSLS